MRLNLIGQNFWNPNWRGGRLCGAKEKGREKLESIKPTSWIDLGKSLKPLSFYIELETRYSCGCFHEEWPKIGTHLGEENRLQWQPRGSEEKVGIQACEPTSKL